MFLLNWVGSLQKLSSLYRWGALHRIWVQAWPRSVTCVHKPLTPRMKHTRIPRTVRRDIWRLAMESLSIGLHIFWRRIRNQIKIRIENRKKTNGPSRKSNRLNKIKKSSTYLVPHWITTWADWCSAMFTNLSFLQTKRYEETQWADFAMSDRTSQLCVNLYLHQSALPYMDGCNLSCSSTKRPGRLGSTIQIQEQTFHVKRFREKSK